MAFHKVDLLLWWIWAASQTPSFELIRLTWSCGRCVFSKDDLPRSLDMLHRIPRFKREGRVFSLTGMGPPIELSPEIIHLELGGNFPFHVPIDDITQLPPRLEAHVSKGSRRPYWPIGFPNSIPVDVTAEVFKLRSSERYPMLPCKCIALNCTNEVDGSSTGFIKLIEPYGNPAYVGESPLTQIQEPYGLTDRQKLILSTLFKKKAFDKEHVVTRERLLLEEENPGIDPTNITKAAKRLWKELHLIESTQWGYFLLPSGIDYCKRWCVSQ